jgi:hypothetical protein
MERVRRVLAGALAAGTAIALIGFGPAAGASARSSTLSEASQLGNRRFVVTGDRFYEVGAQDATYPASCSTGSGSPPTAPGSRPAGSPRARATPA